jgi:hypothetical protein
LGDISRKAYLSELQRRGTLQDDYDEEEDFLQIEEEVKLGLSKLMIDEDEDDQNVESDVGKTETGDESSGASGVAG